MYFFLACVRHVQLKMARVKTKPRLYYASTWQLCVMEDLTSELESINNRLELIEEELYQLLEEQKELEDRKDIITVQLKSLQDTPLTTTPNSIDWETGSFQWTDKVHSTLKTRFNLSSFRPLQLSCINATLSGKDVILIMPTGGGKSLCYQLPAVVGKRMDPGGVPAGVSHGGPADVCR